MAAGSRASKYTSKLQGKRILILGGTSGIGFCVAEAAVEYGATVIVSSSKQANIDKTLSRLRTSYPDSTDKIAGYACDLADLATVEKNLTALLDFATESGEKKLTAIVNTAGDNLQRPKLADVKAEQINAAGIVRFQSNLMLGKVIAAQPGRYLPVSNASSITLTGGVLATKPPPDWSAMAGWATAKDGLVKGLAVDLKPIRVNLVTPGLVHTEMVERIAGNSKERLAAMFEMHKGKMLTGEVGHPEDITEAYLWFIKDRGVTGTTAVSDSGYLLA